MVFLIVAAVLLTWLLVRVRREPRRLSNGVYLVLVLLFLGMGVLTLVSSTAAEIIVGGLLVAAPLFALVLAAFLVANGWTMLRREGRRVANALTFAAGLGILVMAVALLAGWIVMVRTHSGVLAVVIGTIVLLASYVGFVFTVFLLYSVLYGRIPQRTGHSAIVVLGASVRDGLVRPLLAARLDRALDLYRRETASGYQPLVITAGGRGADEPVSEAAVMARYLGERGVPDASLIREDASTSTKENLKFTKALLAEHRVDGRLLVVTSNYHVLRAAILTRQLGLAADVRGARTARYFLPNAFLREFIALIVQYPVTNAVAALAVGSLVPLLALYG